MSADGREDRRRKPACTDPSDARAARLKAALQANIARRKAQARARAAAPGQDLQDRENRDDE